MKKLLLILAIILSSCTSKYKYLIKDKRGDHYLCNFYNKTSDGCILFNDKPGYDNTPGFPTRLCPPYTVKKLK
jgi:hypothetical protein